MIFNLFRRLTTRARYRMARAAPLTITGRRPVILCEADLEERLARRRANRGARSAASRLGWSTRRKPMPANSE